VEVLENEGMPIFRGEGFGNLYVTYQVVFPTTVDDQFVRDIQFAFESRRKRLRSGGSEKDEL
jgi:DnaJ-class molecular chaperone